MNCKLLSAGLLLGGWIVSHAQQPPAPPVLPVPPAPVVKPLVPVPPQAISQTALPVPNVIPIPQPPQPTTPPDALKFDSERKEYTSKPGEASAPFTFWVTNTHSTDVTINNITPSCGCTAAKAPPMPWSLKPGESGSFDLAMNLASKSGTISKGVAVHTSSGSKNLLITVHMPAGAGVAGAPMGDVDRIKNMQMALSDRQVVFKGDCAQCHATPAVGKTGHQLYLGVCGNCHDSPHRASMVPDLRALKHPTNAEHWRKWITSGRVGSMMPAFSQKEGGPLSDEQIESLVTFLVATIPATPQAAPATPVPVQTTTINPQVIPIKPPASSLK